MARRMALEPASIAASWTGAANRLSPELRERVRRLVMGAANAQVRSDALSQVAVHRGNAGFAVKFDEAVALRQIFEFFFGQRLIFDELLEHIVRDRHAAAGFPVADGLGLFEFAVEGDFGLHVEPESEIRTQRGLVDSVEIIAAD